jgi:hypothetical protein
MDNRAGRKLRRWIGNREFIAQVLMTVKIMAAWVAIFGGIWLMDSFVSSRSGQGAESRTSLCGTRHA